MTQAHEHHGIDYIELSVTDMAQSQDFFASAFGWSFQAYGQSYAGIGIGGREVGGLSLVSSVTPGRAAPLVILYSNDLEATLAAVKNAGARITKEPFDFPGGRRFEFLDPSGNELGVWGLRG